LRQLAPGTVLYFRKADLVNKGREVIALPDTFYPLGFVDDGKLEHKGKPMHSVRIPIGAQNQPRFEIKGILFLHLQRLRPNTQQAKRRFYQVKENDFGVNRWYWRRKRYNKEDFMGWKLPLKPTPPVWLSYPAALGFRLETLQEAPENWFDQEVLQCIAKNGDKRYWLDDIWDKDWQSYAELKGVVLKSFQGPPYLLCIGLRFFDLLFSWLYDLKTHLMSR
jgi:hypothetical protein